MTLYLVTDGQYSDRDVVAVLSDQALAQQLAAHLPYGEVLPMTLDATADSLRQGLLPFLVDFARDGSVHGCYATMTDDFAAEDESYFVWAPSAPTAIASAQQRHQAARATEEP